MLAAIKKQEYLDRLGRRPKTCSDLRAAWRGGAFALCGAALSKLVDPSRQEAESVTKLRMVAIRMFQYAADHCSDGRYHSQRSSIVVEKC